MNEYLKNLSKIEFVVTYACTGSCKHCQEGEHSACGDAIDPTVAAVAVKKVATQYKIETVMAFGGEPLLCPDAVYAIMNAATDAGVAKRQIITNGFFTTNPTKMREVTSRLAESGVNDLLLSVDAFHQETIPLDTVKRFAFEAKKCGLPVRLQPAWLVSSEHDNPYNAKTREILSSFADLDIPVGEGNVIFPAGNAIKYLAEYFTDNMTENPYEESPYDVRCLSFEPNGNVLNSNVYRQDVIEIIDQYKP